MTGGAVVLDIEGVTSSLSSVRDQLFPYARRRIDEWVGRPEAADLVAEARATVGRPDATIAEVADLFRTWIDADAKDPALKTLQGMIWRDGFATGELMAHIYEDVPDALRGWHDSGTRVFIYSSGSVLAQRLWFAHTPFGDLTPWLSGFFDTRNAGPKREPSSYGVIAATIALTAERILFASDTAAELDAASAAGWRTVHIVRPDEDVAPATGHPASADLRSLAPDPARLVAGEA